MNPGAIQRTQIEVAAPSSAKDKTHLSLEPHTIEEAKAMHVLGSRVALPFPSFSDGRLVDLAIVMPHPLHEVPGTI